MITDLPSSAVTLAVMNLAAEKNKVILPTGPASLRITNDDCNATTIHWALHELEQRSRTVDALRGRRAG